VHPTVSILTVPGRLAALRKTVAGALAGALLLASVPFATGAAADTPRSVVATMQSALLDVWEQADDLSAEQRYERLEPAMEQAFDFERMIQVATGPAWGRATPEEQAQLKQAFTRYSVATYATRFSEYTGQRFDIANERSGPRDLTLVDTIIVRPAGESVPLTYVVSTESDPPQIVDVIHRGVSEMAIRRSDYRNIVTRSGPRVLAQRLEQQAEDLLRE
jgi:phospholipid transport system substrate-binding protein